MRKEPQIFNSLNVQRKPVSDDILDVLDSAMANEQTLREYIQGSLSFDNLSPQNMPPAYSAYRSPGSNDLLLPPLPSKLLDEDYITGVLGIQIPLNESYPFSAELQNQIIEEHLMLEGFFGDYAKLGNDAKNFALTLRYIFEDKSRIGAYVSALGENIKEFSEPINQWISAVNDAISKLGEKAQKVLGKFIEFVKSLGEKVSAMVDKIKGLAGWKQAILATGAFVGLAYAWKYLKKLGAGEILEDLKGLIPGSTNESYSPVPSASLATAIYETETPEQLNEFLGSLFGKGNKDAKEMGVELGKGAKVPADGVLISKDQAKSAGIDSKTPEETELEKKDAERVAKANQVDDAVDQADKASSAAEELGVTDSNLFEQVKKSVGKMVKSAGKSVMKSLAIDALAGALGGGIGVALKWMAKVWGGLKFVLKTLSPTLSKFAGQIKDEKKEKAEAEKGLDDPTDSASSQKKEDKKSDPAAEKNESLIRAYVRNKLLMSGRYA